MDYIIKDVLGSGAFGEVRTCEHKVSGQIRAVKIINKEHFSTNDADV